MIFPRIANKLYNSIASTQIYTLYYWAHSRLFFSRFVVSIWIFANLKIQKIYKFYYYIKVFDLDLVIRLWDISHVKLGNNYSLVLCSLRHLMIFYYNVDFSSENKFFVRCYLCTNKNLFSYYVWNYFVQILSSRHSIHILSALHTYKLFLNFSWIVRTSKL